MKKFISEIYCDGNDDTDSRTYDMLRQYGKQFRIGLHFC